jgi:hypothetical protein
MKILTVLAILVSTFSTAQSFTTQYSSLGKNKMLWEITDTTITMTQMEPSLIKICEKNGISPVSTIKIEKKRVVSENANEYYSSNGDYKVRIVVTNLNENYVVKYDVIDTFTNEVTSISYIEKLTK